MASPHASSFICLPFSNKSDVVTAYTVYFGVCLLSALVGIVGAILFLVQVCKVARATKDTQGGTGISRSQYYILVLLAASDLCADIGVIARSCYWLVFWRLRHLNQETDFSGHLPSAITGAAVESWVFFWYLATYFWTFFFAVDVYNSKHGGKWRLWCSNLVTWTFCIVYVVGSVASLWACPPYQECTNDNLCIISHFLCTLGPIVIFMFSLPIFYGSTWIKMNRTATEGLAVEVWKKEREMSRRKILGIILVFYLCWLVNVFDGIVLITAHALSHGSCTPHALYTYIFDSRYIYVIWLMEAILNPLQGFFNALAYGNICTLLKDIFRSVCRRGAEYHYFTSWSGEYLDVDFRIGRGSIKHTPRKANT